MSTKWERAAHGEEQDKEQFNDLKDVEVKNKIVKREKKTELKKKDKGQDESQELSGK